MLSAQRTKEGSEGLAPLLRIRAETLKILLQGQAHLCRLTARGNDLCHCLDNSVDSTVKRAPRRKIGIKAERHCRCRIRLPMTYGKLRDHRLRGGQLILPAERHEYRSSPNCRVEPLAQPFLAAHVEILEIRKPHILEHTPRLFDERRELLQIGSSLVRRLDSDTDVLPNAVRRQETPLDMHDFLAAPLHDKARLCGHNSNLGRLKILRIRMTQECRNILRREHNRHALL